MVSSANAKKLKKERKLKDEEFIDNGVNEEPPSIDPYEVLELEQEASADDVKKAYRKAALKWHPDKAAESEKATANKKFQEIAFAYAVLSDERRRKRYDLTGSTAEVLDDDDDFDWLKFYQEQFEDLITEENIKRISNEYKGSEEERRDVLNAYTKYKGKLSGVYDAVMLSDILEDDDRFRQIIDEAIEKGTVEPHPAYERETDATRETAKATERKRREDFDKRHGTDAAEKFRAKQKGKKQQNSTNDLGDLAALIQQRQKSRMGGFFDNLEAKYAPTARGKKRGTPMDDEPSEEAFLATREKLSKRAKNGKAKKKVVVEEDDDEEMGEEVIEASEEDVEEDEPKPKKRGKATKKQGRAKAKTKA